MYKISFIIHPREQNLIEEQLFALGASSVSVSPSDSDQLTVTALAESFETINSFFKDHNPLVSELCEEDWKNRWFEHYRGNFINDNIFAGPDPDADEARNSRYFIQLDPRDAFGDGRHPTTILCMRELHSLAQNLSKRALKEMHLLDAGSGSGIISVLAEKLGIGEIDAVELDEAAVSRAEENLKKNNCRSITLHHSDIASFSTERSYSIIVANLLTDIIIKNIHLLKKLAAPRGSLIISGIGSQWDREIREVLQNEGLPVFSVTELENWLCFHVKISP